MKKKKTGTLKTIVFLIFIAAIVFGCFFLVKKKSKDRAQEQATQEAQLSEAEKLIRMDIEKSYPVTAREVLRLYNRILQCLHNDELSDEEITGLAGQLRCLFDPEFLVKNPYEEHVDALILDVRAYNMLDRTISVTEIESASSLVEWENKEGSFSSLNVRYTLKEADQYAQVSERFLFRRQEDGRWKILGWEQIDHNAVEK